MPNPIAQDKPKVAVEDQATAQGAFIERGLASLAAAKKSGEYFSSEDVMRTLNEIIANAKKKTKK